MWKWVIGVFVLFAVLCGGGGTLLVTTGKAKVWIEKLRPKEVLPEVTLEPIERGDLVQTISAPGTIEPETQVTVSAEVSARIVELPFEEGDHVEKGQLVVLLDDTDLKARLDAANASLESQKASRTSAQAARDEALAAFGRAQELFDTGDISRSEYDSARARYLTVDASFTMSGYAIEIAQANIRQAEKDLANTRIVAPMSGMITVMNAEVGETVLGTSFNVGSAIMVIADMSKMLMRARVDETNIAPVKPGQEAVVALNAYPDRKYDGRVRRVKLMRQVAQDGTGYIEAEIVLEVPEGETLYTGLTANADITVDTTKDVLKAPSQAVLDRRIDDLPSKILDKCPFVDRSKTFARVVYRLVDGKAVATPVEIGASDLTHTVIKQGIDEGERVITGPFKILVDLKHDKKLKEKAEEESEDEAGDKAEGKEGAGDTPGDNGTDADDQEAVTADGGDEASGDG